MPGGTMKTQNEQWGQSNYEVSKLHIILKPMLLRGTLIFFCLHNSTEKDSIADLTVEN